MEPYFFDIIRGSTVDGPGVRTTVFFKGCNLNCFWCHNPEGKKPLPEPAFFREKCIGCGACVRVCPEALRSCRACGKCAEYCPEGARKIYGKRIPVPELMTVLRADRPFFEATGGGVTFSGGECMLYPEYLTEIAAECRKEGIDTAIDTAGNVDFASFEKVLPFASRFLYDIKALDPELHRRGTGVGNERILGNLEELIRRGCRIEIRVPVIPGFNEGEETERILRFCTERELPVKLLPYHEMGESKKKALSDAAARPEER